MSETTNTDRAATAQHFALYTLSTREYDTIATALGVSHRQALAYFAASAESVRGRGSAYWVGELWDIDRAQRTLSLDNTQR